MGANELSEIVYGPGPRLSPAELAGRIVTQQFRDGLSLLQQAIDQGNVDRIETAEQHLSALTEQFPGLRAQIHTSENEV